MKFRLITLLALLTAAAGSAAQDADVRITGSDGNARVSYVGDNQRLGIGIDDDGDLHGEYLHVFGADARSNWIGELWASDERGGVKLNYHWLVGADSVEQAAARQDDVRVAKTFLAVDQNQFSDRKVTLGIGWEGPELFWGAYVMKGITGRRFSARLVDTEVSGLSGIVGNQQFIQDQFDDTITTIYERAYDQGAGLRLGRYFDESMIRLRGGLDFETGRDGADQVTASVGVEKFFANTPHSVALNAQFLDRSGSLVTDSSDTRAMAFYRYAFGQRHRSSYAAARDTLERRIESSTPAVAAVTDQRLVKNQVTLEETVLFQLDRAQLQSAARSAVDQILNRIQEMTVVGLISVDGHTCDLAATDYNQALSQRRADSVADYLAAKGVERSTMEVHAYGESRPAVPNTSEENRRQNRRVEIHFVTLEQRNEEFVVSPAKAGGSEVRWERTEIQDPAWLERALRNPIAHKREVDTYRYAEVARDRRLGPQVIVNTFPSAQDDSVTTDQDQAITIDVLANDADPDGDPLTLVSVGQPANGSATVVGNQVVYTPNPGYFGNDGFTYIVRDGGGEDAAIVSITVLELPPIVANNDSASTLRTQPVTLDLLANDSGENLTLVQVDNPANGTLAVNGGQITYTPNRAFVGTEVLNYQIGDDRGQSANATVTITVAPFNQAPIAGNDSAETRKNTAVVIDVLANDSDPDGDPLTIVAVDEHTPFGSAAITADGQIRYTPMPGWWGGDEFTYTVDDGFGGQATATVTLTVTSQNWGK